MLQITFLVGDVIFGEYLLISCSAYNSVFGAEKVCKTLIRARFYELNPKIGFFV